MKVYFDQTVIDDECNINRVTYHEIENNNIKEKCYMERLDNILMELRDKTKTPRIYYPNNELQKKALEYDLHLLQHPRYYSKCYQKNL